MDDKLTQQIRSNMESMKTADLLKIWESNNKDEYSEEAFHVVKEILEERGERLPDQKVPEDKDKRYAKKKTQQDPVKLAQGAILWIGMGCLFWFLLHLINFIPGFDKYTWLDLFLGCTFIVLWERARKRSRAAFVIAIVLTGIINIYNIVNLLQILSHGDIPLGIGGFILTIFLFIWMIKGLRAMKTVAPSQNNG
ncbi:MAG TPA: hypothetical protein VMT62_03670 [Syntrophorhabdaceae bacterium]|nr:hypothetical protein [Syntrophorhabdaceae bacterium]